MEGEEFERSWLEMVRHKDLRELVMRFPRPDASAKERAEGLVALLREHARRRWGSVGGSGWRAPAAGALGVPDEFLG